MRVSIHKKCNLFSKLLFVILLFSSTQIYAQDEPLWQALQQNFKKDYFSVGALLQVVGDGQLERSFQGTTGFNVSNMRISFSGELDSGFGYFFQTNFISSPTVLDAKLYYRLSKRLTLDVGQFKAPFSAEFLIPASGIDMVNRSQAVSLLAPGRQIGVQLKGWLSTDNLHFSAGLFNGNGTGSNSNDNNDFLYAGRLTFYPLQLKNRDTTNRLELGLNFAYSKDDRTSLLGGFVQSFRGTRNLIGGDFRWSNETLLLSGEIVSATLDFPIDTQIKPWGYHLTGGMMLNGKSQLLLRWDSMTFDINTLESDLIVLGYNLWPTQVTEVQINYIIDTDRSEIKHHQLLINAQIAF